MPAKARKSYRLTPETLYQIAQLGLTWGGHLKPADATTVIAESVRLAYAASLKKTSKKSRAAS